MAFVFFVTCLVHPARGHNTALTLPEHCTHARTLARAPASTMHFPEEWDTRQRSSTMAGSTQGMAPARAARSITNAELNSFANDVAYKHVNVGTQFMRSLNSDLDNITDRINSLLPDNTEHMRKRKAAGAEPVGEEAAKPRSDMRLELDTLLSRLPYKLLMQDMVPYHGDKKLPSIPYVTRVYEEMYMREPIQADERPCAMGEQCECMFIDRANQFTGVEFLVPGEEQGPTPQPCVLCSRALTQQLFYDIVFDNASFASLIQRYGNVHSVPNEYAREAMLICPPNGPIHAMPLPIMSHQRNRYNVVKVGGVRYIRQHSVYFQ